MTDHEPAADETAALRARLDLETVLALSAALTGASLGITTIDEAGAPPFVTSRRCSTKSLTAPWGGRALTGASLGGITTIDEAGAPQTFVTSGFTEAEHRRMAEWADGPRLFEHFRALEGAAPERRLHGLRARPWLPHGPAAV